MTDQPFVSPEAQAARLQQAKEFVCQKAAAVRANQRWAEAERYEAVADLLLTQQRALEEAQRAADCPMLMCPYEKRAAAAEAQVASLTAALTALLSGEPRHFTGCTCVTCGLRAALSASPSANKEERA